VLEQYAPKDKHTPEVCNTPPRSICEADYGLSIGRGSFKFTPGQWTHVSQTVVLNTPGKQDGYFTLDVNGERVMDLSGLYYRQKGAADWDDEDEDEDESAEAEDATSPDGGDASGQDVGNSNQNDSDDGGLLGQVLVAPPGAIRRPLMNSSRLDIWNTPGRQPVFLAPNPYLRHNLRRDGFAPPPSARPHVLVMTKLQMPATITVVSQVTKTHFTIVTETRAAEATRRPTEGVNIINLAATGKIPGFSGIFFRYVDSLSDCAY
jgi:hypothetical protein